MSSLVACESCDKVYRVFSLLQLYGLENHLLYRINTDTLENQYWHCNLHPPSSLKIINFNAGNKRI